MKISDLKGYKVVESGTGVLPAKEQPQEQGVLSRVGNVVNTAGRNVQEAISGEGQYAGQNPLTRGLEATASAFNAIPQTVNAALPEPARQATAAVGDVVGKGFSVLTNLIGSNPELQKWVQEHPEAASKVMEVAQGASSAGQIAGDILSTKGTADTLQKGVDLTKSAVGRATSKIVDNSASLIKPKKDLEATVGEILQGKPKDIAKGVEALKNIDTAGVKSYKELGSRVDDSISKLSKVVDEELAQDVTKTPLQELTTSLKTKSGNTVSTNYVDTALNHLKELYQSTGDVRGVADIDELTKLAKTEGLTKLEINDIARVYNTEFGAKAFNKVGEPLTSVNAQLYETIRKGVKNKAREGIGGEAAKAADKTISNLYNTKSLVGKNVDAVNKLQQKIAERGVFEKAGYLVSKYADVLSGGTIRGLVGGILPRGAGYKTMNALDLESRLQNNLKIIEKASKASSDAQMTSILSQLDK